jgi:hypothetical protein
MWAIDRSNLIILGIAVGIMALLGLALLFAPVDQLEPVGSSSPTQGTAPTPPAAVEPEPIAGIVQPVPVPTPAPAVSVEASPSTPIVDGVIHTGEYAHAMEAGGFRVYWTNDAIVLRMGLLSPGTGYLAIGLDPELRMQGANFILGAVRNGHTEMRDDYGTGPLSHSADVDHGGSSDILAYAGRELNGQTTIEFIIPLDSGDPFDKPLQPGNTYEVLVAFHNTDDSFSARHSQRGSGELRLDEASP